MQRGVSSSVPACAASFQILYHFGLAEAACQAQSFVPESSATEFVVIEPSRTTVDRNGLAFERQIGIGRIVQEDAVFVLHYHRHGVIDVDVFAPDTAIAQVAVFRFTIDVEFYVILILGNVPIEFALLFEWANTAVRAAEGVVPPVEFQVSEGRQDRK